MWQLGIIIEIRSRKELLGPIWSLPRGQGSIIPFSMLPDALFRLVVRVWEMAFFAVISTAKHSRLNLMAGIQSAFSVEFLFHMMLKRGLGRHEKDLFCNPFVSLQVN